VVAPGHKRLTRDKRLHSAPHWLAKYRGKDVVRGYRKWLGVSEACAVVELRMLGVDIPDARLEQAKRDEQARAAHRARRKEKHARAPAAAERDDELAFTAGYTEGGAPYGLGWLDSGAAADEVQMWQKLAEAEGIVFRPLDDDDDLPF